MKITLTSLIQTKFRTTLKKAKKFAILLIEAAGGNPNLVRLLKAGKPKNISKSYFSHYGDEIVDLISHIPSGELDLFVPKTKADARSLEYMYYRCGGNSDYIQSSVKPDIWFQTSFWKPTPKSKKIPVIFEHRGKGFEILAVAFPQKSVEYALEEMAKFSDVARRVLQDLDKETAPTPQRIDQMTSLDDILVLRDKSKFDKFLSKNKEMLFYALKKNRSMINSMPGGFDSNADDVYQELTMKMWSIINNDSVLAELKKYDGSPDLGIVFFRILARSFINQIKDILKRKQNKDRRQVVDLNDEDSEHEPASYDPEFKDEKHVLQSISKLRLSLKPTEQKVFDFLVNEAADKGEIPHGFNKRMMIELGIKNAVEASRILDSVKSKIMESGLQKEFVNYIQQIAARNVARMWTRLIRINGYRETVRQQSRRIAKRIGVI